PVVRLLLYFFFQAEVGIRALIVTGVQTCALPICLSEQLGEHRAAVPEHVLIGATTIFPRVSPIRRGQHDRHGGTRHVPLAARGRSEERRVGKGVELGGSRITKKKTRGLKL